MPILADLEQRAEDGRFVILNPGRNRGRALHPPPQGCSPESKDLAEKSMNHCSRDRREGARNCSAFA